MIDEHISDIEALEAAGFIVLLKWDGERTKKKRTILISKPGKDDFFRRDCDDIVSALQEGLKWAERQHKKDKP
jgi:hypothetical protein